MKGARVSFSELPVRTELSPFGRALKELLCQSGAVRSYPIEPSTADLMHDIEVAIRQMVKEELDRTGRYPL